MLNEFINHIDNQFPELKERSFLLACSGGVDSVVLTYLCHKAGLDFTMAHCNFKLRGQESDDDEKFVRNLAVELNKKIHVTNFETISYVSKNKVSIQMAARELRYAWFDEIMQKNGIKILVTAHQSDDNLETFLINLSRGTGIDGLTGIPAQNHFISRPLLAFSRERIMAYAKEKGFHWREDSSNSDTKYLRNKIRHQLVPLLKELHPTFLDNFLMTQTHLAQTATIAEDHIHILQQSLFMEEGDTIKISIASLLNLKPIAAYLYHLLKPYGFTEWNDVKQLLSSMSGKEVRSKTHRLLRDREHLILTQLTTTSIENYLITEEDTEIQAPIHLTIAPVDTIEETGKNILYIDKKALKYPLLIRKWKKGDYFHPIGMQGKKKLSKYFKDEKIDIISKEKQWLLCSENKIVWVIGKRADNRFKVTNSTKNIIQIIVN